MLRSCSLALYRCAIVVSHEQGATISLQRLSNYNFMTNRLLGLAPRKAKVRHMRIVGMMGRTDFFDMLAMIRLYGASQRVWHVLSAVEIFKTARGIYRKVPFIDNEKKGSNIGGSANFDVKCKIGCRYGLVAHTVTWKAPKLRKIRNVTTSRGPRRVVIADRKSRDDHFLRFVTFPLRPCASCRPT